MKKQILLFLAAILCFSCSKSDSNDNNQSFVNNVNVSITKDDGEIIEVSLNNAEFNAHCENAVLLNASATSGSGDVFAFFLNLDFILQEDANFPQTFNSSGPYNNIYYGSSFKWNNEIYTITSTSYSINNFKYAEEPDTDIRGYAYGTYTIEVESSGGDSATVVVSFDPIITSGGGC